MFMVKDMLALKERGRVKILFKNLLSNLSETEKKAK